MIALLTAFIFYNMGAGPVFWTLYGILVSFQLAMHVGKMFRDASPK